MKTGLKKKQKVTEVYFNAADATAEVYTHDTELKKRLTAYAAKYQDCASRPMMTSRAVCASRSTSTDSASV